MYFHTIGTAAPGRSFSQLEVWAAMSASPDFAQLSARSQLLLRKVLTGSNGIDRRHLFLDTLTEAFTADPDVLHSRFERGAPRFAAEAAQNALRKGGVLPESVDGLIISTCTGYLCPGLTSYVSEQLGLRSDCRLLDLVGQGCGAALPNLQAARDMLGNAGAEKVLSVCVEICTAAYFLDDDPGVLISACLFGDGAAAAVLGSEPADGGVPSVRWEGAGTRLNPADRDLLRFEQSGGRLRNILRPEVPAIAAREAAAVRDQVLGDAGVEAGEIGQWIFHAGGRNVLDAIAVEMALSEEALLHSREVLRNYGNLSSPFVLFVLERALRHQPCPGLWWMASFGAGFSSHGALLRVG